MTTATGGRSAALAILLALGLPLSVGEEPAEGVRLLQSDSRAPYVHRLTLYDENGTAISPTDEPAAPYSPRATCGKCHPYGEISRGWHFNASEANVAGRPGEPWLLVDERTGTVLPVSGRRWPGTYAPSDIGLTDWQLVKRFGHHLPGGGFGEPSTETAKAAPEAGRWRVSGRLEIDCLFCHGADQRHDPAEAARQIEAENFKWGPTAALGLAAVRGEARKVPDDWDPLAPLNPDHPEQAGPKLVYDKTRFDADDRVFFNITRRVPVERCYFCHSFREVGAAASDDLVESRDVHLAAGLLCVDCHRNDVDHMITRGYETEAAQRGDAARAAFSCAGCHLGTERDPNDPSVTLGGRYAAPHPQHRGLPPLHFEKLTCTACHSGPWPAMDARQFQTALAHGLGVATRERDASTPPLIVAPVFAQPATQVVPHRLVWPQFWGRLAGDKLTPLAPDVVQKKAGSLLPKPSKGTPARLPTLPPDLIASVLERLGGESGADGTPVYVRDGWVHRRAAAGKIETVAGQAVAPYCWPLAHDVRPATQSLGVRGCTDCHEAGTPLDFGRLTPVGSDLASAPRIKTMLELRNDELDIRRAWGLAFKLRPAFKWFGLACAAIIALVFLRFALVGVAIGSVTPGLGAAASQAAVAAPCARGLTTGEHLFHWIAMVGLAIQGVTGLGAQIMRVELREWLLFVHMLGAPLFIAGVTGVALQWARRCQFGDVQAAIGLNLAQRLMFWVYLLLGFVIVLTMLLAMLPLFGYRGQAALINIHGKCAWALVIAIVVHTIVSWRARRARGKTR